MESLSKEQRDILLDYYFDCASVEDAEIAKDLVKKVNGAREFYEKLKHALSPLDHLDIEAPSDCPEHIVEKTIAKLHAQSKETPNIRLRQLLDAEHKKSAKEQPGFWRTALQVGAVAAMVVILSGIFVPVTRQMRAQAWQAGCEFNLNRIARGILNYADDNNNSLPAVNTSAGQPWWKVGSKTQQTHSNTRHVWLLVKHDYLSPKVFVCPGRKTKTIPLEVALAKTFSDFPSKGYITYSSRLICDPAKARIPQALTPLMADSNPIFEGRLEHSNVTSDTEFSPVELCEKLMKINSRNHRGKGQNVMFSDGSVRFIKTRFINNHTDDIFTVRNIVIYRGVEKPDCESDIFLVP